MRDAVGEVNRAVDRIDNPAMFRLDVAGHAFLAQNGDLRIRGAQRFLVLANLHRSAEFKNMHVHFSREALEWLGLHKQPDAELSFRERLDEKISLKAKAGDLTAAGLVVPAIPALTPFYFEIK